MTNQQKQWFPLSSANVVNEDGFPVSYYDLTQFKDDDTIYVGDDLFAFNKPFEDLREIIITMRENFDEKVFEISTNYPKKLVEFLKEYNDKQENFFRGLALKHAISLIASMEDFLIR